MSSVLVSPRFQPVAFIEMYYMALLQTIFMFLAEAVLLTYLKTLAYDRLQKPSLSSDPWQLKRSDLPR